MDREFWKGAAALVTVGAATGMGVGMGLVASRLINDSVDKAVTTIERKRQSNAA